MLADTAHQPLGNEHARGQSLGRGAGHQPHAAPVVLHRQMLEVLLDRRDRDEAADQFAGRHALAKLAARQFSEDGFWCSVAHNQSLVFKRVAI